MYAMSASSEKHIVSSYNDLKVELTYKIKIQPVGLFI